MTLSSGSFSIFTSSNASGSNEVFQLPTGFDYIHDSIIVDNKYYVVTRDSATNHFIRFNNLHDLTNYDSIALPYGASNIVVVNNVAYLQYFSPANDQHLRVGAVDLSTMILSMPLDEVQTGFYPYYSAACTDGTYYYNLSAGSLLTINKYRISDWANVGSYNATVHYGRGHNIMYKDGILYGTSYQSATNAQGHPANNWIIKVDATTLTEIERNDTFPATTGACTAFTDDGAIVGDKIFIGVELNATNEANIFVFDRTNLANYTTITVPEVGSAGHCVGIFYDGHFIYGCFNTTPGIITKIDPNTNAIVNTVILGSGLQSPNEIAFNFPTRELFITYFQSPSKVSRNYKLI